MSIMLGNLSVNQIEERTGVTFPNEVKEWMNECRQENASNIAKGKWHCFDIPFTLVCGDVETARKIYDSVKERLPEFKEILGISVQQ